jgi:hypothetical protein
MVHHLVLFMPSLGFIAVLAITIALILLFVSLFFKTIFEHLRLYYIIFVHGKYSYEFLQFFSVRNLRNPHSSCISDEIRQHFISFFKENFSESVHFQTVVPIDFEDTQFLLDFKKILRKNGKPNGINISKEEGSYIKVLGYYDQIENVKMRSLYFFHDDIFVMGEYIFASLTPKLPGEVTNTLSNKYLDGIEIKGDTYFIKDLAGNQILYKDNGFTVSIKYICTGDKHTFETLTHHFGVKKKDESNKHEPNLKFIKRF